MSISVLFCSPASPAVGSGMQKGASRLPGHFSASCLHSLFKPPLTPQVERKARGSTGKWYRMLQCHIGGLWGWHCGSIETSPCRKLPLSHSQMQAVPMATCQHPLSYHFQRKTPLRKSPGPQQYVPGQVPREQITPGRFSHCPCATLTLVLPLAKRQMPALVPLPSESSSSGPGLDTPSALGSVFRPLSESPRLTCVARKHTALHHTRPRTPRSEVQHLLTYLTMGRSVSWAKTAGRKNFLFVWSPHT